MISHCGLKKSTDELTWAEVRSFGITNPYSCISAFTFVKPHPIYVVSDLHAADGGPRDSFSYKDRESQFDDFLSYVKMNNGQLVIAGDLLDLWQCNISKVIMHRRPLLDKLFNMGAIYIIGNHDSDLNYFLGTNLIHPLIKHAVRSYNVVIGDKVIDIIHGHEVDPFCASDVPGIGRITAIMSGIAEDKNGSPMLGSKTVANKVTGPMDRFVSHFDWLRGKPSRYVAMNRELKKFCTTDILISGHTHLPGHIGNWYYNTGTWAEFKNSFVKIDDNVTVYDWNNGNPAVDTTELKI